MWFKTKQRSPAVLSPEMGKLWGYLRVRHLILATSGFIVFIDDALDIDWKTTSRWDQSHRKEDEKHSAVMNRAAALESGEWDHSDEKKTLNFRRQIAEAIACCLNYDYVNAQQMLDSATAYRDKALQEASRKRAIDTQVKIRDGWHRQYRVWTILHYAIGIAALFFSSLVASRPALLGMSDALVSFFAWLVALCTGLLTFLTPDKQADKYRRAWSILNNQTTRYFADETVKVDRILDACQQGESVIFEASARGAGKPR
jgi:hypothetical protein